MRMERLQGPQEALLRLVGVITDLLRVTDGQHAGICGERVVANPQHRAARLSNDVAHEVERALDVRRRSAGRPHVGTSRAATERSDGRNSCADAEFVNGFSIDPRLTHGGFIVLSHSMGTPRDLRVLQSGRRDLNPRPPRPERDRVQACYLHVRVENADDLRFRTSRCCEFVSQRRVPSPSLGDEKGTRFRHRSTVCAYGQSLSLV